MDKKNVNRKLREKRDQSKANNKKKQDKDTNKTRPDRGGDNGGQDRRKDSSPDSPPTKVSLPSPKQPQCKQLDELITSAAFQEDLRRIAALLDDELTAGLAIGEIAKKRIGDHRYSRFLNADRFADHFTQFTGRELTGRMVRYYVDAYDEHQFHEKVGKQFQNLGVSHLAQINKSRWGNQEERLTLAERADHKKVTVRQIKQLAQQLHAEYEQARRVVDLVPIEAKVTVVEAHDLLLEQDNGSIECGILDWQWSPREWGRNHDYPKVHTPEDPVEHLCRCLEILKQKLSSVGSIFLFHTPVGFLDPRIPEMCNSIGLRHAGKLIWQKTCGGFQDADTMLRIGHEEIHILSHEGYKPKATNGGTNSVTPKWGAPTHATCGDQHNAVHLHQKPVTLMELLISISTVNGLVADPFAGSGAAGIAAVRLGCSYVGSELMPEIAGIANRRIALAHGENEQVIEAVNFFANNADHEQYAAIATSLEKCGLSCVQNSIGRQYQSN